eukprot:1265541-Rhodomonas_salina.3
MHRAACRAEQTRQTRVMQGARPAGLGSQRARDANLPSAKRQPSEHDTAHVGRQQMGALVHKLNALRHL